MIKIDDFQTRNLSSVGRILGTQTSKWGGRYDKKWRFSKKEFEFGWPDFMYQLKKWGGRYDKKWQCLKEEFEFGWPDFRYTNFKNMLNTLYKNRYTNLNILYKRLCNKLSYLQTLYIIIFKKYIHN